MFLQDVGTNPVEEKTTKMKKEENRNGKKKDIHIERENKSFKLQQQNGCKTSMDQIFSPPII